MTPGPHRASADGFSPMTSTAARRPSHPTPTAPLALLVAVLALPAGATEPSPRPRPPAAPPIWTTVPTRIDPGAETRERLAPAPSALPVPGFRVTGARAADGGSLIVDGRRHRLYCLSAVEPRRLCTTADGARWVCGRRAQAALSALVAGRSLHCRHTADPAAAVPVLDCLLDDRSISERLVAEGWAELDADGAATPALAAALDTARRTGRGIWSTTGAPTDDR